MDSSLNVSLPGLSRMNIGALGTFCETDTVSTPPQTLISFTPLQIDAMSDPSRVANGAITCDVK